MIDPKNIQTRAGTHPKDPPTMVTVEAQLIMMASQKIDVRTHPPVIVDKLKETVKEDLRAAIWMAMYPYDELIRPIQEVVAYMQKHYNPASYPPENPPWGLLLEVVGKMRYKRPLIVHDSQPGVNPSVNGE